MSHTKEVAIRVSGLGKMYRLYSKPSDVLWELLTRKQRHREHWAVNHVSFEVNRGEVVGVIGRNGAGKTTLLRIIAGTLDQTVGKIEVKGRVSAIMVLGTGFNMDLTGRENILLGGLCLGMTHEEVERKTQDIINFSGIKEFIDSPCKEYSSGMLARLAFSVAASVDPEILIVDEALSTGDMVFLSKSYARMREIARSGATVLFVTHSLQQIYDLCDSAILMEGGKIVCQGSPRSVGYMYEQQINEEVARVNQAQATVHQIGINVDEPPSSKARITHVDLLDANGIPVRRMRDGENYEIKVVVEAEEDIANASVGYHIRTVSGVRIYGFSTATNGIEVSLKKGEKKTFRFSLMAILNNGPYIINFGLAEGDTIHYTMLHVITDGILFEAETNEKFPGIVNMRGQFLSEVSV